VQRTQEFSCEERIAVMDQVALANQNSVDRVGKIPPNLVHPQSVRRPSDPPNSTLCVASSIKNSTVNRWSPCRVHTSMVKESAATISSQWRLRNSFQVVFRFGSGARSIPFQDLSDRAAR
jgi:hypothetical protein